MTNLINTLSELSITANEFNENVTSYLDLCNSLNRVQEELSEINRSIDELRSQFVEQQEILAKGVAIIEENVGSLVGSDSESDTESESDEEEGESGSESELDTEDEEEEEDDESESETESEDEQEYLSKDDKTKIKDLIAEIKNGFRSGLSSYESSIEDFTTISDTIEEHLAELVECIEDVEETKCSIEDLVDEIDELIELE